MNEIHARTSRHEALHCVAAYWLGWQVDAVSRPHAGGLHGATHLSKTPPSGLEPRELGLRKAAVFLIPAIDDPTDDTCEEDINEADILVRLSGIPLSKVWAAAQALLVDPSFREQVRRVEYALHETTLLSGAEIRHLMFHGE